MTVLFVVLPLAVLLSLLAAFAFAWATRRGQFDDLETPAVRLLTDELSDRTFDGSHDHAKIASKAGENRDQRNIGAIRDPGGR
jgi:cbb3-type cytochrome oxidase maturation protein